MSGSFSMLSLEIRGSPSASDLGKAASADLGVWIYFNLISNCILLPILVATFIFSKRVHRHPTLINMCLTWVFSGIISLLLFFDGTASGPKQPSQALCIAQASLLYGILPMWSVAVLVLSYFIHATISGLPRIQNNRVTTIVLISAPYIAQIAFTIAGVIESVKHRGSVKRKAFYCNLPLDPLYNAMSIFVFIMCLGIILLKIQLALIVYRNWRAQRHAHEHISFEIQLLLRVLAFGVYVFAGMVCDMITIFDPSNAVPYMYTAVAGTVVFLVFGTQTDVLRVWCFWRQPDPEPLGPVDWRRLTPNPGHGAKPETPGPEVASHPIPPLPARAQIMRHTFSSDEHVHTPRYAIV